MARLVRRLTPEESLAGRNARQWASGWSTGKGKRREHRMLAAHLDILERKGNRWCVGTTAWGETEEALLEDADKATAYYRSPEYLQYRPDAQVHVAEITDYCAECNGSGQVRSARAPGHKRCPTCKGKRSTVTLYRDDVRITWPKYSKGATA